MKLIKTEEAVGQILCHDITQIIPNVKADAVFRKGHIIKEQDIPILLSVGKEHIYIWECDESKYHENEGAEILRQICQNDHMTATLPKEGKIEIFAQMDGLLTVDTALLREINSLGEMMIATRNSHYPVKKGEKLCGTRVIPLLIDKKKMEMAEKVADGRKILTLNPYVRKKYAIIVTGSEIFHGRITDQFSPVLEEKMNEYDCTLVKKKICDDDHESITKAIIDMKNLGAELILCTGGMSVDPDDRTPLAIKNSGAKIISYGSPVLPGAMFLLSYFQEGVPVCGLPGCVMYAKKTVFDIVLPLLLTDITVSSTFLANLGHGGLCLSCPECHFPNCGFGKGFQ